MNFKDRYDVVVVGCGPGGSVAGKMAAREGVSVLIVDKKRDLGFPIHDFASVIYSLPETCEHAAINADVSWVACKIEQNEYFSGSGKHGGGQPWPEGGCAIYRDKFEKALAIDAIHSGAAMMVHSRVVGLLRENNCVCGVIVKNGSQVKEIKCSVVIGADGVYGNVARWAGLSVPREACILGLAWELVGVRPGAPKPWTYELHLGEFTRGFHAMVSPRGEDRLNVGMMVSPHMLKGKESLRGLVKGFMDHLEKINRFDFSKAYSVSLMAGATHPTRLMAENIISDGLVLVGDGAWRPPVGTRWGCAGMNNAIVTGKLAGVAVAEAIKEGNVSRRGLTRYVDRIEATLEGQKQKILEGRNYFHKLVVLSPQRQDKAMEEIGNHISSLHHYMRGALPLVGCLEPIKEWFRKEGLENA